jgi:hypothetical protein
MAQHQDRGPVSVLCEVWEVRRREFSADRQGPAPSAIARSAIPVVARVKAMAAQTGQR